jgi:hypothetical protein
MTARQLWGSCRFLQAVNCDARAPRRDANSMAIHLDDIEVDCKYAFQR